MKCWLNACEVTPKKKVTADRLTEATVWSSPKSTDAHNDYQLLIDCVHWHPQKLYTLTEHFNETSYSALSQIMYIVWDQHYSTAVHLMVTKNSINSSYEAPLSHQVGPEADYILHRIRTRSVQNILLTTSNMSCAWKEQLAQYPSPDLVMTAWAFQPSRLKHTAEYTTTQCHNDSNNGLSQQKRLVRVAKVPPDCLVLTITVRTCQSQSLADDHEPTGMYGKGKE